MLPDATSPTDYGLPKNNRSFVTDPRTEFSYEEIEAAMVDIAALTRTCPRAWARIDATSGTPVLVAHDSVWGNDDAIKPTITDNGAGDYTIAWPSTVTDLNPTVSRRVTRNLNIRSGWVQMHEPSFSIPTCSLELVNSYSVSVKTYEDIVGTDSRFTVFVL